MRSPHNKLKDYLYVHEMRVVKLGGNSLADDVVASHASVTLYEEWRMSEVEVPADGSCFFHCIATAMDEDTDVWYDIEELRAPMERYWQAYTNGAAVACAGVTSSLIRFMCAENIDDELLLKYNVEAQYRKETLKEKGVVVYKDMQQFKRHVLRPDTWADHSIVSAFLKSLNFRCGLAVIDPECGGITYLPPEWTKRKPLYIFLLRKRNHYSVLRLEKRGMDLNLCVSYADTKAFVDWMAANSKGSVHSEF